jgi:protein TonB
VLSAVHPGRSRRALIAAAVTVAVHGAFWAVTHARGRRSESASESSVPASRPFERPPTRDTYVDLDLDLTAPHRKRPEPEPARTAAIRHAHSSRRDTARAPAAPARAASIVASEPAPDAPEDLTGEAFVVGSAPTYAGGLTSANGGGAGAGRSPTGTGSGGPAGPPGGPTGAPDRSSAVALADQSWSCPWPRDADAETIDEQTVLIRVVVAADGTAESTEVLSDPGHGFAHATTTCAMHTRFTPARDREGRPIRARSPPIKVRFTR